MARVHSGKGETMERFRLICLYSMHFLMPIIHIHQLLQATVLLAVNVSYLAIPLAGLSTDAATLGQAASLCSTLTSIGCIVIGLLLINEDHIDPKSGYGVSCHRL